MKECIVKISGIRFEHRPRIESRKDAVHLLEKINGGGLRITHTAGRFAPDRKKRTGGTLP